MTRDAAASKSGKPITQRLKPSIKLYLDLLRLSCQSHHECQINLIKAVPSVEAPAFLEAFEGLLIVTELMVGPSKIGPDPYAKTLCTINIIGVGLGDGSDGTDKGRYSRA